MADLPSEPEIATQAKRASWERRTLVEADLYQLPGALSAAGHMRTA
jgi:hypothetical protein